MRKAVDYNISFENVVSKLYYLRFLELLISLLEMGLALGVEIFPKFSIHDWYAVFDSEGDIIR